jgi:hypothetical protein
MAYWFFYFLPTHMAFRQTPRFWIVPGLYRPMMIDQPVQIKRLPEWNFQAEIMDLKTSYFYLVLWVEIRRRYGTGAN